MFWTLNFAADYNGPLRKIVAGLLRYYTDTVHFDKIFSDLKMNGLYQIF